MCIQMIIAQCYVVVPTLDFYLRQGDYIFRSVGLSLC